MGSTSVQTQTWTKTSGDSEVAAANSELQPITAQNVQKLFPGSVGYLAEPKEEANQNVERDLQGQGHQQKQVKAMEEVCILLDRDDSPIGGANKYICHRMDNIKRGLLHRAFSVFLFDSQNRLLLQQRADEKITYPDMWTNTVCSHPLNYPEEGGADLAAAVSGAKNAAVRKLWDEIRLEPTLKNGKPLLDEFQFLTRIIYQAPNVGPKEKPGEEIWGEHEIDYILFVKADVDHTANPSEAKATRYVAQDELTAMIKDDSLKFTPWFKLIQKEKLYIWWDRLAKGEKITTEAEETEIMELQKL